MKLTLQGLDCSERYITVYVKVSHASWVRFSEVKIPIEAFLDEKITSAMDRVVRRKLIEVWSEVDICDPLF